MAGFKCIIKQDIDAAGGDKKAIAAAEDASIERQKEYVRKSRGWASSGWRPNKRYRVSSKDLVVTLDNQALLLLHWFVKI